MRLVWSDGGVRLGLGTQVLSEMHYQPPPRRQDVPERSFQSLMANLLSPAVVFLLNNYASSAPHLLLYSASVVECLIMCPVSCPLELTSLKKRHTIPRKEVTGCAVRPLRELCREFPRREFQEFPQQPVLLLSA